MSERIEDFGFTSLDLRSELTLAAIIGHGIIWILLSLVTFGLALFVFPYYLQRFVIGYTYVYEGGQRVGKLDCTIDFASILGNVILWAIISLITFGIGYLIFLYKINAHCLNHTRIIRF